MQAINYLVPLITLPYLTRVLGVDNYGVMGFSLSIIQYGVLFINFGFSLSATKIISENRDNNSYMTQCFWETFIAKLTLLLVACGILIFLIQNIDKFGEVKFIIYIYFIQLLAAAIDPIWFFQGIERLEKVSLIGSFIRLLNIPLLFLLVNSIDDVALAAFIQSILLLSVSLVNLVLVYKAKIISFLTIKKIKKLNIFYALKASLPIFIGSAAISLYSNSTPIILGLVNNYEEVGVYSASFRLQSAVVGVFTVLGHVLYPRVNYLFSKNIESGYFFVRKIIIVITPILLLAAFLFYSLIPYFALWLFGNEFEGVVMTLKIMAPMILLIPLSVVLAHGVLLPLGFSKIYFVIPMIIGILHVFYSILLSKNYGAVGASYSILITEILSFIALLAACLFKTDLIKYFCSKR